MPGALVLVQPAVPHPQHVAQQPQRHERIRRALVLEQQVDQRPALPGRPAKGRLVHEVCVALAELVVHEAARPQRQLLEVELFDDPGRQKPAEVRRRVARLAEHCLEQAVVGIRHRRAPSHRSKRSGNFRAPSLGPSSLAPKDWCFGSAEDGLEQAVVGVNTIGFRGRTAAAATARTHAGAHHPKHSPPARHRNETRPGIWWRRRRRQALDRAMATTGF